MLNRFQLNNEGVWASQTVSSAQCIAWPSPTLILLLACQAVNLVDSHRYRLARLKDNGMALSLLQLCSKHWWDRYCINSEHRVPDILIFNSYLRKALTQGLRGDATVCHRASQYSDEQKRTNT